MNLLSFVVLCGGYLLFFYIFLVDFVMCDAGLSTDATFTSDEAPWEVVTEDGKVDENKEENGKSGDPPKEVDPDITKEKEKEIEGRNDEPKEEATQEEADFGGDEVEVVENTDVETGLTTMKSLANALPAVEATEDEKGTATATHLAPGQNSLTTIRPLVPQPPDHPPPTHLTAKSSSGKSTDGIPLPLVKKRDFFGAAKDTDSELMPPPKVPAIGPLSTAKPKPASKPAPKNRGRSKGPKILNHAPEEDEHKRSRSLIRMPKPKPRTPVLISGTRMHNDKSEITKPMSEKEKFLQDTAKEYHQEHDYQSAASYNLHIGLYYYVSSDRWPVTAPSQLNALVLCQDSSMEERWWCYHCDLKKGSGSRRMHTSWPTPEAQCCHWWSEHATDKDWTWIHEAVRLGVSVHDLAWHLLWVDLDESPLPSSERALPLLPLKLPSLAGGKPHNPVVFQPPLSRQETPHFHASERRMRKEREATVVQHEPEKDKNTKNADNFTAFGWESPLDLFKKHCDREIGILIHPFDDVKSYSRHRTHLHFEQFNMRSPLMEFILTVEEHSFYMAILKVMTTKVLLTSDKYSWSLREKSLALHAVLPGRFEAKIREEMPRFRYPRHLDGFIQGVLQQAVEMCRIAPPCMVENLPKPFTPTKEAESTSYDLSTLD